MTTWITATTSSSTSTWSQQTTSMPGYATAEAYWDRTGVFWDSGSTWDSAEDDPTWTQVTGPTD